MYGIIYKVKNIVNKKVYIGQTTRKLLYRQTNHYYKMNSVNYPFYNAIRKHGKENFEWGEIDSAATKEELDSMEIFWIDFYRSTEKKFGYNAKTGGSVPVFNEETLLKISKSGIGRKASRETKEKLSRIHIGKAIRPKGYIMSDSQKLAISLSNKGKGLGRKVSREAIEKQRQKLIGVKKSKDHIEKVRIALLSSENIKVRPVVNLETGRIYDRISHAAKSYGVAATNIMACCRKKPKHATSAGCHWEYFPIPFLSPDTAPPASTPSP
jgi:group I intron endonuclease